MLGLREEDQPGEAPLLIAGDAGRAAPGTGPGTIEAAPGPVRRELGAVSGEALALDAPRPRVVRVSDDLEALAEQARAEALHRAPG